MVGTVVTCLNLGQTPIQLSVDDKMEFRATILGGSKGVKTPTNLLSPNSQLSQQTEFFSIPKTNVFEF